MVSKNAHNLIFSYLGTLRLNPQVSELFHFYRVDEVMYLGIFRKLFLKF